MVAPLEHFMRADPKCKPSISCAKQRRFKTCNACAKQRKRRRDRARADTGACRRQQLRRTAGRWVRSCRELDFAARPEHLGSAGRDDDAGGRAAPATPPPPAAQAALDNVDHLDHLDHDFVIGQYAQQQRACAYCGCEMKARGAAQLAVGRKDPCLLHVPANVVLSCYRCYQLREDDYTFEEFQMLTEGS